jgi:uncharacterized membrane protein YqjE
MAVPESTGPSASSGLFGSLRSFWSVLIAILHTRLDLVSTELEDEAVRAIKLAIAGVISMLALFAAFFWANFFILALFWDTEYRLWVLGIIFFIYLGIGLGLLAVARNMILNRPKFLSQTIAELRRDVEGLTRAIPVKKEESRP